MKRTMTRMRRTIGLVVVSVVAAMLLSAATAFADTTPADGQYGGVKGEQAGGGGGGSLPFTGLDLLAITAVGGVLVAGGVGLRAAARR
jgi:hypothetical protein